MATAPVATAASANPVAVHAGRGGQEGRPGGHAQLRVQHHRVRPGQRRVRQDPAGHAEAKVLANKAELTKILTYHVASGRYTPAQLAAGTPIKTLEGATVTPA